MTRMFLIVLLAMLVSVRPSAGGGPDPIRVASFNIRYGSADDGPDRWSLRRARVIETIRALDADVVGLQEAEAFQIRELLATIPRYAAVGVCRDDGGLVGEASPVLYDRTRFTLASGETFWLSDSPAQVGSNTWGRTCVRVCTVARLVDLGSGETLEVYNTHFDHESQVARERSADLIARRITARRVQIPVVVMGDLNAGEDNPATARLREVSLTDSFRVIHPGERRGTFTGFATDSDGGVKKIDYVFVGTGLRVLEAGIDRRKIGGRFPSDHFPVWAAIELGTK